MTVSSSFHLNVSNCCYVLICLGYKTLWKTDWQPLRLHRLEKRKWIHTWAEMSSGDSRCWDGVREGSLPCATAQEGFVEETRLVLFPEWTGQSIKVYLVLSCVSPCPSCWASHQCIWFPNSAIEELVRVDDACSAQTSVVTSAVAAHTNTDWEARQTCGPQKF